MNPLVPEPAPTAPGSVTPSEPAVLEVGARRLGSSAAAVHPDLLWTVGIMAGIRPVVVAAHTGPPGETRRFCSLPGVGRARFLLPVETPAALRAALVADNGLRSPQRRAARALIERMVRVAPLIRLVGDDVTVHVPTPRSGDLPPLWTPLSELFGEPVLLATSIHRRGPHRKPLFQVLTRDGRTRGYVKVGWDATTSDAIDVEARALARHDELKAAGVITPRVLHHGSWGPHRLLVTAPLPPAVSRYTWRDPSPPASALRAVAPRGSTWSGPIGGSAYLSALRRRLEAQQDVALVAPVLGALARLQATAGDVVVETGAWHGDWVPWNLARSGGDELLAWDWEFAGQDVPIGFDCLHYHFEVQATVRRRGAGHSYGSATDRSLAALAELGLDVRARTVVQTLYLMEIFNRRLAIHRAGGSVDPTFLRDISDLLAGNAPAGS